MTPLEVRAAATHTLHLDSIPSDDVLLAGPLARVEQTEMAALEMLRQLELAAP